MDRIQITSSKHKFANALHIIMVLPADYQKYLGLDSSPLALFLLNFLLVEFELLALQDVPAITPRVVSAIPTRAHCSDTPCDYFG